MRYITSEYKPIPFTLHDTLAHASTTRMVELGQGVLPRAAAMFKELFPGKPAVVVSHKATWPLAGDTLTQSLKAEGVATVEPIIFTCDDFHAEWKHIEHLDALLAGTEAIPIALGSGTVNDLCKCSSHHQGRPYMVVATAASMDGYVASGASITRDGIKSTFACPAPLGVVADVDLICTAPAQMTASGYADLFAKIPAGADWMLAHYLGKEPIDHTAWSIAQGGVRAALAHPVACSQNEPQAIQALTQGLLMGGFAMQAYPQSSRPASGADHQFSHMLNMDNYVMPDGTMPSHGFQVAIGTLVSLYFYRLLMMEDAAGWDVYHVQTPWPTQQEMMDEARRMFAGTPFADFAAGEVAAKYSTRDQVTEELFTMQHNWCYRVEDLRAQLCTVEEAQEKLRQVGAPWQARQLGMTKEQFLSTILRSQRIRRRFTVLDFAQRIDRLELWAKWTADALY